MSYIWVAWYNLFLGFASCSQVCWELEIILKTKIKLVYQGYHITLSFWLHYLWESINSISHDLVHLDHFDFFSEYQTCSNLCKSCQPGPKANPLRGHRSVPVPATLDEKIISYQWWRFKAIWHSHFLPSKGRKHWREQWRGKEQPQEGTQKLPPIACVKKLTCHVGWHLLFLVVLLVSREEENKFIKRKET